MFREFSFYSTQDCSLLDTCLYYQICVDSSSFPSSFLRLFKLFSIFFSRPSDLDNIPIASMLHFSRAFSVQFSLIGIRLFSKESISFFISMSSDLHSPPPSSPSTKSHGETSLPPSQFLRYPLICSLPIQSE